MERPIRINVKSLYRVTVSTAIVDNGHLLLIREGKGSDRKQWNLPGGKLKVDEDFIVGAEREAHEETNYEVRVRNLVGMYCYPTASIQRMRLVFHADILGGDPAFDGDEILDVRWFAFNQISKMPNKRLSRAPMLRQIIKDIRANHEYPLGMIQHLKTPQNLAEE